MRLSTGTRLHLYEILGLIGAGGMGEVAVKSRSIWEWLPQALASLKLRDPTLHMFWADHQIQQSRRALCAGYRRPSA
jgi:hypothetical protein